MGSEADLVPCAGGDVEEGGGEVVIGSSIKNYLREIQRSAPKYFHKCLVPLIKPGNLVYMLI